MKTLWTLVFVSFAIGSYLTSPRTIHANSYGQKPSSHLSSQSVPLICTPSLPYSPNISWKSGEKSVLGTSTQVNQPTIAITTPTPSPIPTQVPPTLTPEPTSIPTPIPEDDAEVDLPQEDNQPARTPTEVEVDTSGHSSTKILELINQHRGGKGLTAYPTDDRLCQIANQRIPQLQGEMFGGNYIHQGFDQMKHEFWITENMVYQPSEEAALAWWLRSGLHRTAIESTKHTHSCGACSGQVCIQLFTSFIPK